MPTDRERQTLEFVRAYTAEHGFPPKLREIASHLGIQSRGTVHRYLSALRQAGLIEIEPERARGIQVTGPTELKGSEETDIAGPGTLPLLGRIAAGIPIEAIPGQDCINLSEFFVRPNRFVLRVQGDSMMDDGILDGDMVIVEKRDSADDNEIVVALIDLEEATLKRLQRNPDGSVTLHPANCDMQPMRYSGERVRIQGVVVGQFRSYR
ncbi:MAG: transcriptional repressor LexA [Gammaproteobacteria bacterium]|nr:transcriptional repressor LexA [Gammaproteobacteria bacterium]